MDVFAEEKCEVSKWGATDEIGSANLVSNANTLNAIKLVKKECHMVWGL